MNFKEQIAHDLDNVFFNQDEFGEEITYNGTPIIAIESDGFLTSTTIPGVTLPTRSYAIKQSDVPTPKTGDKVIADGQTWHVGPGSLLSGGVWTVTLNRQTLNVGV